MLRHHGYTVFGDMDDEVAIPRELGAPPYYVDVCACDSQGIIVVEIDGYVGHRTRRAILKDRNRTTEILDYFRRWGVMARLCRLAFWQLKNTPDDLIAQELRLC